MTIDEERREVARRLRFNAGTAPYMNTADDFAREVFRAAMDETVGDYRAATDRLADLIEPCCDRDTPQKVAEEMFGKMRHSTKEEADAYDYMLKSKSVEIHPVDRDALLALADEIDIIASFAEESGRASVSMGTGSLMEIERRIREAVGA